MSFNTTKTQQDKNKFVMTLVSRKSDKATAWVNLMDSFVISVFQGAKSTKDLTANQVQDKLFNYYSNDFVYLVVKDLEAELITIDPTQF